MAISSLRDLLSGSLKRAGVLRSVRASMIVEAANRMIPAYLPAFRSRDVQAVSFQNGTLRLLARNAPARHLMKNHEADLLTKLHVEFPTAPIERIQLIVSHEPVRYELS
ncbi:DUF721 domain-containing protein [Candidatus Uhrbacteria bacterium]|nr:DUF721 domain-containing protein [Candidatus Uhrbacteria bacterium]